MLNSVLRFAVRPPIEQISRSGGHLGRSVVVSFGEGHGAVLKLWLLNLCGTTYYGKHMTHGVSHLERE